MTIIRTARAGSAVEDYCRACKTDRIHTVIAADPQGQPLRVSCGFCRSEHNYRGGPRIATDSPAAPAREPSGTASPLPSTAARPRRQSLDAPARRQSNDAFPIVSDRERSAPPVMLSQDASIDLELLLRRIIREEAGVTPVAPAERWRGGSLVLRPGTPGLQEKSIPIETFFHKIVMLRNRLRTLEQQVNASDLPDDAKVKLQAYVSGCYGSLTTFNVLFADEDDQFKGSGGE
ncbi:MAG TPA: hypothetical protein VMS54_10520 [Vicinamibacterales bacterium]|nr:hypothetical protein [Vicinamibacterales bacterium]